MSKRKKWLYTGAILGSLALSILCARIAIYEYQNGTDTFDYVSMGITAAGMVIWWGITVMVSIMAADANRGRR